MTSELGTWDDTSSTFPPLGKKIKALLVWPKIPNSFWTFSGMVELLLEKAVMPPLGLITLAALCPDHWTLRLIDEAVEELKDEDILWADLVMVGRTPSDFGPSTPPGPPHHAGWAVPQRRTSPHARDRGPRGVGEPDEVFLEIAKDLEEDTARQLYEITDKPDVTRTPMPRFDLLKLDCYTAIPGLRSISCTRCPARPFTIACRKRGGYWSPGAAAAMAHLPTSVRPWTPEFCFGVLEERSSRFTNRRRSLSARGGLCRSGRQTHASIPPSSRPPARFSASRPDPSGSRAFVPPTGSRIGNFSSRCLAGTPWIAPRSRWPSFS
jgi:hypothetical protein